MEVCGGRGQVWRGAGLGGSEKEGGAELYRNSNESYCRIEMVTNGCVCLGDGGSVKE